MMDKLRKVWGFRSGTPWKIILAVIYYAACLAFLIIGMLTPPLVAAGAWDTFVVKVSTFVLFLWMASPGILLSDTSLRSRIPFFRKRIRMYSLVGLMIAFVFLSSLFSTTESLHTASYREAFNTYITQSYEYFVEVGNSGS